MTGENFWEFQKNVILSEKPNAFWYNCTITISEGYLAAVTAELSDDGALTIEGTGGDGGLHGERPAPVLWQEGLWMRE